MTERKRRHQRHLSGPGDVWDGGRVRYRSCRMPGAVGATGCSSPYYKDATTAGDQRVRIASSTVCRMAALHVSQIDRTRRWITLTTGDASTKSIEVMLTMHECNGRRVANGLLHLRTRALLPVLDLDRKAVVCICGQDSSMQCGDNEVDIRSLKLAYATF